jgi:hypothetical protein
MDLVGVRILLRAGTVLQLLLRRPRQSFAVPMRNSEIKAGSSTPSGLGTNTRIICLMVAVSVKILVVAASIILR